MNQNNQKCCRIKNDQIFTTNEMRRCLVEIIIFVIKACTLDLTAF